MTIRAQLKTGRLGWSSNHNNSLQVRSALKAGRLAVNHVEPLAVRSALKAGRIALNHSEPLQVRSTLKAGGMRRKIRGSNQEDRLRLLVVRAGLKAGRGRQTAVRHRNGG